MSGPRRNGIDIEELYRQYGKSLYNLAYRMTGSSEVAEDVMHDVFVRVVEHASDFRGESTLYTWLFSITRNVAVRVRQRSVRGHEKAIEASRTEPPRSFSDEFERQYYVDQVKDGCLTGLLQCLSFHQRLAFIMNVLFDISTATVAQLREHGRPVAPTRIDPTLRRKAVTGDRSSRDQ
jgi:RNA polymerase sigma-70 factor, ECF subfamily